MQREPRRPGQKPFIPFARFEDVVVKCGHVEKFGLLPEGKDRFRDARRQKAISRECKACREKRQQEELAAAEIRRVEKEKRRLHHEQQSRQPKGGRVQTSRLPDGSSFEVRYDGQKERWSGTLSIPTPTGVVTFTGSQSGLFPLLSSLDRQYRATLPPDDSSDPAPNPAPVS